jgi:mannose-6-phosphate isomerase
VRTGDAIFIPSGRLHAIGAGLVIFEIQQNSDTTYRVFDWNRTGLDGKPRALHIEESLACIDFADTAPALVPPGADTLADCPFFHVQRRALATDETVNATGFCILGVVAGSLIVDGISHTAGSFVLVPASGPDRDSLKAGPTGATLLEISLPEISLP